MPSNSHLAPAAGARAFRLSILGTAAALALTACGGGGGGSGSTATPAATSGNLQIRLVDGPATDDAHVWITVTAIWVHALDSADTTAPGWQKLVLPAPVTLDMNALANGALSSVLGSLNLPVGTYKQIRLLLAPANAALTSSAQAQTPPLQYNDQVNYTDANGVAQVAPLEIAQASQGISLVGTFNVTAGGTLDLAIEFDVGDDVVKFKHGGGDAFTMTPVLHYYDLNQAGAIVGQIDTAGCTALGANPCSAFIIKAEVPSSDATFHTVERWTAARADGTFALYPLPASAGQTYDLMLRGRYAQTMIVQGVPVTVGTTPSTSPTVLSSAALPAHSASEYSVNWAAPNDPTGVYARFYQTVATGGIPYEIRTQVMNPFTGEFTDNFPLVTSSVLVGTYVGGGNPTLVATVPTEGTGGYDAVVSGWGLARGAAGIVTPPTSGNISAITPVTMQPGPNIAGFGTISGTIAQTTPGRYDSGYLVVSRGGAIVNTVNVASVLQAGAGSGGSYSIGDLPAGSASAPIGKNGNGAGIYYAYLRVWNSASPLTTTKLVEIPGEADLDATNTATLNATIP